MAHRALADLGPRQRKARLRAAMNNALFQVNVINNAIPEDQQPASGNMSLDISTRVQNKGLPTLPMKKSPSAPSLALKKSPSRRKTSKFPPCALLNPELLQRHALSVDNPRYSPPKVSRESLEHNKMNGSQVSMAMDLYIPNKGPVTLKIKDRSDTARRHQLLRQMKIEDEEEEARKMMAKRHQLSDPTALPLGSYSRYPADFIPRKRASMDLKLTDKYGTTGLLSRGGSSPRDFRKSSSPNFRNMSFDRIGERRVDRSNQRKASLDIRRSPDFRRESRYLIDELDQRSRANTADSVRKQRQKLHHSRSDDNRRRSFDRHRRDSHQTSRHSLNAPVVTEACVPEYELKYFAAASLERDETRSNVSDESHGMEMKESQVSVTTASVEEHVEDDALLEEPELENDDVATSARGTVLVNKQTVGEVHVHVDQECPDDEIDGSLC